VSDDEIVNETLCHLRREVIETKITALKDCDTALENRMKGIECGIEEVRTLQKTILYAIIFIAIGVCLTLFGVVVGRGFDFGWLHP